MPASATAPPNDRPGVCLIHPAEDDVTLGDRLPVHCRFDFELKKVANLAEPRRTKSDAFVRSSRRKKFHLPNGRKKEARFLGMTFTGGRGNSGGLGKRLSEDHPWHEWISREVSGKHRVTG